MGFKKVNPKQSMQKPESEKENDDSGSNSNSFAKPRKSDFNPVA
jgi:hypothetical protein